MNPNAVPFVPRVSGVVVYYKTTTPDNSGSLCDYRSPDSDVLLAKKGCSISNEYKYTPEEGFVLKHPGNLMKYSENSRMFSPKNLHTAQFSKELDTMPWPDFIEVEYHNGVATHVSIPTQVSDEIRNEKRRAYNAYHDRSLQMLL